MSEQIITLQHTFVLGDTKRLQNKHVCPILVSFLGTFLGLSAARHHDLNRRGPALLLLNHPDVFSSLNPVQFPHFPVHENESNASVFVFEDCLNCISAVALDAGVALHLIENAFGSDLIEDLVIHHHHYMLRGLHFVLDDLPRILDPLPLRDDLSDIREKIRSAVLREN